MAKLPAQDIVERLRNADANSQQRTLRSRIFGEAAATISRLTADNEALRKERDEARAERDNFRDACELIAKFGEKIAGQRNAAESRADALAQEVAEARRLLANSLKEYAPISAASHRSEIQAFLSRSALANEEAGQ